MDIDQLLADAGAEGDPAQFVALAHDLEAQGELRLAATAYDRAYGLAPQDAAISAARQQLLDRLAVVEHGVVFRYIPAGSFLMGSASGEPDEQPVHRVQLHDYWLAETPVSWAAYCDLMGWEPPPNGYPKDAFEESAKDEPKRLRRELFSLYFANRIRLQYCEDETLHANDWHTHLPTVPGEHETNLRRIFGEPERAHPEQPWGYSRKPMIAVAWQEAEELGARLSTENVIYRLPTESEWEKGARGGLINQRYPWGDELPTSDRCDFDRFDQFAIQPMRRFAPNGYGLYAMSGCVWEWTRDWYDALYYAESQQSLIQNPTGPESGEEKVIRGGSWADCADVVTVSFRASRSSESWHSGKGGNHFAPNFGFRLCRVERPMT